MCLIFIQCNYRVATSYKQPILTLLICNNGCIIIYAPTYLLGCIVWSENDGESIILHTFIAMNVCLFWIFRRLHTVADIAAVQQSSCRAGLLDSEHRQDEATE